MWTRRLLRFLIDSAVILAAGAAASVFLLRLAPGSGVDARELDPRFSAETIDAIRAERAARDGNALRRTASAFAAMARGDFGASDTSGQPVSELLRQRVPETARTVFSGSAIGFVLSVAIAAGTVLLLPRAAEVAASAAFLGLLSLPAGLIALFAVFGRIPIDLAVAAAVAPRIFFLCAGLCARHRSAPWVLGAVCAGVSPLRIALFQVLPALRSELAALYGLALLIALGASIPVEVLSGRPGLGLLAWQSAMERDLPVVIAVTIIMILLARAVTLISSVSSGTTRPAV